MLSHLRAQPDRPRRHQLGARDRAEDLRPIGDVGQGVESGFRLRRDNSFEVDLHGLACRVAKRYQALASQRNMRIAVSGSSVEVSGDPTLLERIVANLVDNAVKYSPPDTTVQVEVSCEEQWARLTVRDEGPGITPEHVPHLFTRFFRGDPARPRAEGSGLGLSIAKVGAEAHGGTLEYLGDTHGGVFRLTLPTAEPSHS